MFTIMNNQFGFVIQFYKLIEFKNKSKVLLNFAALKGNTR